MIGLCKEKLKANFWSLLYPANLAGKGQTRFQSSIQLSNIFLISSVIQEYIFLTDVSISLCNDTNVTQGCIFKELGFKLPARFRDPSFLICPSTQV